MPSATTLAPTPFVLTACALALSAHKDATPLRHLEQTAVPARQTATPLSRAEHVARVTHWFEAQGGFHEPVVAREIVNQGWGLVARRDICAGDVLVRTPRHLSMCAADCPDWLQRTAPSFARLTAAGAITCRLADEMVLGESSRWACFIASLPTRADLDDVPALWADGHELLAGTQSARSRQQIVDQWSLEFSVANQRRQACNEPPYDWETWAYAQTLVMSRGYNVPNLEYAIVPFVDFVSQLRIFPEHLRVLG